MGESPLEDRVVMASGPAFLRNAALVAFLNRQGMAGGQFAQAQSARSPFMFNSRQALFNFQLNGRQPLTNPGRQFGNLGNVSQGSLARAQFNTESRLLQSNYAKQIISVAKSVTDAVRQATVDLYANGTPTAAQLADANARIGGIANAAAYQLSSQFALLPGSEQLVSRVQNALIGSGPTSLTSRLANLTRNGSRFSAPSFQSALTQTVTSAIQGGTSGYSNLFAGSNLYNATLNQATGQRMSLPQYIGGRLINQVNNTLGMLSQTFANVGNSALFPGGLSTATPEAMQAFAAQYNPALGLAASQIGGGLALFPNAAAVTNPLIQSSLFNGQNSLVSSLSGLNSSTGFSTGVSNAFQNAFQSIAGNLNNVFTLPSGESVNLRTNNFSSVINPQFNGVGNGFNTGFSTTGNSVNFPGFGTPGVDFNNNFGTGFNNYVSTLNQGLGFSNPNTGLNTGTGTGTGTGTSLGTGSVPVA